MTGMPNEVKLITDHLQHTSVFSVQNEENDKWLEKQSKNSVSDNRLSFQKRSLKPIFTWIVDFYYILD